MRYSRDYKLQVVNNFLFSLNVRTIEHWITLCKNVDSFNSPTRDVGRNFERGVESACSCKLVHGEDIYSQLAGHRGWVREGDVPPPPKAEALDTFRFTTLICQLLLETSAMCNQTLLAMTILHSFTQSYHDVQSTSLTIPHYIVVEVFCKYTAWLFASNKHDYVIP